jgi:molybdate transport system substrate-binding protein
VRGGLTGLAILVALASVSSTGPAMPVQTVAATAPRAAVSGTVAVFADSSLGLAFRAIQDAFQRDHPGVQVDLTFGPSATLGRELQHGVPADVFATMDPPTLRRLLLGRAVAGGVYLFARNQLQIVVAANNPKGIRTLGDLDNAGLVVATCRRVLPCGRDTVLTFARAGIPLVGSGEEQDSLGVIDKVGAGKADAGLVYATDLDAAGGKVQAVDIPDTANVMPWYMIVLMLYTDNDRAATAFLEFVLSGRGQAIMSRYGFTAP